MFFSTSRENDSTMLKTLHPLSTWKGVAVSPNIGKIVGVRWKYQWLNESLIKHAHTHRSKCF